MQARPVSGIATVGELTNGQLAVVAKGHLLTIGVLRSVEDGLGLRRREAQVGIQRPNLQAQVSFELRTHLLHQHLRAGILCDLLLVLNRRSGAILGKGISIPLQSLLDLLRRFFLVGLRLQHHIYLLCGGWGCLLTGIANEEHGALVEALLVDGLVKFQGLSIWLEDLHIFRQLILPLHRQHFHKHGDAVHGGADEDLLHFPAGKLKLQHQLQALHRLHSGIGMQQPWPRDDAIPEVLWT
mmetsp:Transcript_60890/g.130896  ORF Transcript_60890/g.130896 Transcript_60890/m.130896 type:complete len:240 (+) Transcript_60890:421-1140(+)